MVILLFGLTNVGKTVTGKKLAEKLEYSFYDLDEEIKKMYEITLEEFMHIYPYQHERYKIKGNILKTLIEKHPNNTVIAVSPIYYARNFNCLIDLEHVIAIELQDSKEHIFERLVFSDENDNLYWDDEYKQKHKNYYLKDIHEDIVYSREVYKNIQNKYFINNKPVDEVADELIDMITRISVKVKRKVKRDGSF